MSKLYVYLLDDYIGDVYLNNSQLTFAYAKNWLEQQKSQALSHSLPLQEKPHTKKAESFISGLLPEGKQRELIKSHLGTSSIYKILEAIGGECAGGVSFYKTHEKAKASQNQYKSIGEEELYETLIEISKTPILTNTQDARLSLAGAQNKLPIYISSEDKLSIPKFSSPSTHILKPDNSNFPNLAVNEYICMRLAHKMELSVAEVSLHRVKDLNYLCVNRYDRIIKDGVLSRLHQEDFCQALGIMPEHKYQTSNGPTIKKCFELINVASSQKAIDRLQLLKVIIFNLLIGNNDAHGKNFSLLYHHKPDVKFKGELSLHLAPFYDLVSTIYYPSLASQMAMSLGGEYEGNNIHLAHFEKLAEQNNISPTQMKKEVLQMLEHIMSLAESLKQDILQKHPEETKAIEYIFTSLNQRFFFFKGRFSS